MPPADADVRVWRVDRRSPELEELLKQGDVTRMHVLPVVIVRADRPRELAPPDGAVPIPHHRRDDLWIAKAIDQFLFECAAFLEVAPGGCDWVAAPGFPYLDKAADTLTVNVAELPKVERGYPTSLSLSLQLPPRAPFSDDSVLALATREASKHCPVFVAVGNFGSLRDDADSHDLRSPLARLPWVISVGATIDDEGTSLTRSSSVGAAGGPGPSIVSHGANLFVDDVNESSFAAPRAATAVALITAFLLQLRAATKAARTGETQGLPLTLMGFVDTGFPDWEPEQRRQLPMIPFGYGIDLDSCQAAIRALLGHQLWLSVNPNTELITALLLHSARPGPGSAHESGAGLVNMTSLLAMLTSLTWRGLFTLAGKALPDDEVFDRTMADPATLPALYELTIATRLVYGFDFRREWMGATVRPPGLDPRG